MPSGASNERLAQGIRGIAAAERNAVVRYRELEVALLKAHPETLTTSEWTRLRVNLLETFRGRIDGATELARFLDNLAEIVDELGRDS